MKDKLVIQYLVSSLAADIHLSRLDSPRFSEERRPEEIWKQKVFCILSSQFNAEKSAVIAERILDEIPFFECPLSTMEVEQACYQILSSPSTGYRFPRVRSRQISFCWFSFAQIRDEYHDYIQSYNSEEQARDELVATFPGIGLKQASMFLRNIGATSTLCVIDIHVLYYLRICHHWEVESLTYKRYRQAEEILRNDAARHDVSLNVFDTIIWAAARAHKRTVARV
jgi:N-glycosylase/DNA lyase